MKLWLVLFTLIPLSFKNGGNIVTTKQTETEINVDWSNLSFNRLSKKERLERVKPYLYQISKETCIPAYILISFWIEETGWGTSDVFLYDHNWGGVRHHNQYVGYSSFKEGLYAWSKVLQKERYSINFPKDTTDYIGWVDAYHKGGYWEEVEEWRMNRIRLIKQNKLL